MKKLNIYLLEIKNIIILIKMKDTILFLFVILFSFLHQSNSYNIVGWFNGDQDQISQIPFHYLTHVVTGIPTFDDQGNVFCNKNDTLTQKVVRLAHEKGIKVQWRQGFIDYDRLFNKSKRYMTQNYLDTLPTALAECDIDGVEFDYEWNDVPHWIGLVSKKMANTYTDFLSNVKKTIGDKVVSADIGTWGCCCVSCGYPLGILPWINATRLNNGEFDFINSMSYHWSSTGSIYQWEQDRFIFEEIWKYDLSRINLGVGYFSMNSTIIKIFGEPSWNAQSHNCPNVSPNTNMCDGLRFVGKDMNFKIGQFAKRSGFGGLFPWTINYDSFENNNTLIDWLMLGFNTA